mmetsp:Transcript_28528/g.44936  ORF Transcript_28528/g.44936 Transcript_28528/m.44936 type:complete len:148 (+) Transcript_28528:124-567(+)
MDTEEQPSMKRVRRCVSSSGSEVNRRKRTSRRGKSDVDLRCNSCNIIIPSTSDYVQNLPCHHKICTLSLCVVKSNMKRGSNPACCQVESCDQQYTESCQYFSAGSPADVIPNKSVGADGYSKQFLPMEYLITNHRQEIIDKNKHNQV